MLSRTSQSYSMIDLEALVIQYAPSLWQKIPDIARLLFLKILRRVLSLDIIEEFLNSHHGVRGFNLIDEFIDFLECIISCLFTRT